MASVLDPHLPDIPALCRRYGVRRLELFGSAATAAFDPAQIEIIGEAANRLAQYDPGTAARISKCRQIVDFRNVLTHGYDLVDHRVVWGTIDEEVPVLLAEVEGLLCGAR